MKKQVITISLLFAFAVSMSASFAESTIYTDGIGRLHFLGRDKGTSHADFTNPAEQDLTRHLYDKTSNEVSNDEGFWQHPLKNYENTFLDSRFKSHDSFKKYGSKSDEPDSSIIEAAQKNKASYTAEKGAIDASNPYIFGTTNLDQQGEKNIIKNSKKKKNKDK